MTKKLCMGADRARQRTDMEMLGGTDGGSQSSRCIGGRASGCGWDVDKLRSKCRVSCKGGCMVATRLVLQEVKMMNVSWKSGTQQIEWRAQG